MIAAQINDYPRQDFAAAARQTGLSRHVLERISRALAWLAVQEAEALKPGRTDLEGEKLFVNTMVLTTQDPSEKDYEIHRDYLDVHYVFSGEELLGLAPLEFCEPIAPFDQENDFGLVQPNHEAESWVVLHEGDFAIVGPTDAHKPGCSVGGPERLVKACVKIALDI